MKGHIAWGGSRIGFDCIGYRSPFLGRAPLAGAPVWRWLIAYAPDASRIVNAWIWMAKGDWGVGGSVVRDGELLPIATAEQKAIFDDEMTQRSIDVRITDVRGGTRSLQMERCGLVRLSPGGRHATMMESACRARIDGRDAAEQSSASGRSPISGL